MKFKVRIKNQISLMNSKNGAPSMNFNNPLMLYILMGDGKSNKFDKMLPLMLMMNQNK